MNEIILVPAQTRTGLPEREPLPLTQSPLASEEFRAAPSLDLQTVPRPVGQGFDAFWLRQGLTAVRLRPPAAPFPTDRLVGDAALRRVLGDWTEVGRYAVRTLPSFIEAPKCYGSAKPLDRPSAWPELGADPSQVFFSPHPAMARYFLPDVGSETDPDYQRATALASERAHQFIDHGGKLDQLKLFHRRHELEYRLARET